jgi:ADP-ribose pyrophosphatase
MNESLQERKTVFATPWFQVLAAPAPDEGQPRYVIQGADFVVIVAVTKRGQMLLVRQFRVAAAALTLELPAGHFELGEAPEQAARRELLEETGYEADSRLVPIRRAIHQSHVVLPGGQFQAGYRRGDRA